MSSRTEWESDVTVLQGHAIEIPGVAQLWRDHEGWGGSVQFEALTAVRSDQVIEIDIPGYSTHVVEIVRSQTTREGQRSSTTVRFKGRGQLAVPKAPAKP